MDSVLISIKPKWCMHIINGDKVLEIRKTKPKAEPPFKCYIYCTKPSKTHRVVHHCMAFNNDELYRLPRGNIKYGDSVELMLYDDYSSDNFLNGKVIGEFTCDKITQIYMPDYDTVSVRDCKDSCLMPAEILAYADHKPLYGWHISDLTIYDKPLDLISLGFKRAPQSWCYIQGR